MAPGPPSQVTPAGSRPWLGLLVFAVAASYLFPFWNRVGLDSDEAKIILGTLRIFAGERLYVDIFEFVPPGLYAVVAAALRLSGPDPNIFELRVAVVLFGAASVVATWAVAARATQRPLVALLPAALALVFGLSHWCIASIHWVSTTFALLATWAMLEIGAVRAPWRPWFLTGLATGAVLLVAQHKGVALGAVAVLLAVAYMVHAVRFLDRPRNRLVGPEDAFAVGVVLVLTPLCIGLAARDQFAPMLAAAFGWTREGYGVANAVPYGYGAGILFDPRKWHAVGSTLGLPLSALLRLLLLVALPGCLFAVLGRGLVRWISAPNPAAWADLTVGVVGVAMWLTAWTRPDVLHLLTVAPWGFVGATLLLSRAEPGGPGPGRWVRRGAVGLAVALAVSWGASDQWEQRRWGSVRLGALGFLRYPRDLAPGYSAADSDIAQTIAYLQAVTGPEEPIFVYPYAPYFYYLADRPNPTRYNICIPGYQGKAAIDEVIDRLQTSRVSYVVLDPLAHPELLRQAFPGYDPALFAESPLTQYIHTRYAPAQEFGAVRVLRRRGR